MSTTTIIDCDKYLIYGYVKLNHSYIPDDIINVIVDIFRHISSVGKLFDIFYYDGLATQSNIARSFFVQIIDGLKVSHKANIFYRNLSPQNLLLDSNLNLMINYGLSHINERRGYMAPELLLDKNYEADAKCDIFSVGVILFILLAGYPPFEVAAESDKWFKPLLKGKINKFWRNHQYAPIVDNQARDLLAKMLCADPSKRINLAQIQQHEWLKGAILNETKLIVEVCKQHLLAEERRMRAIQRMNGFVDVAITEQSCAFSLFSVQPTLKLFPENEIECLFGEVYTYLGQFEVWTDLYGVLADAVTSRGKGMAEWHEENESLRCGISMMKMRQGIGNEAVNSLSFEIKIYESIYWKGRYLKHPRSSEIKYNNEHRIFTVRITRIKGDCFQFYKFKRNFLLKYCSTILKGLPSWAIWLDNQNNS